MRILVVALNYAPERVGAGRYTAQIAEHLAECGHDVQVLSAPPHFPNWRVRNGYGGMRYSGETIRGVRVVRCPAWTPRNPRVWARLLHDASFAASAALALFALLRRRPDTVLAVAPSIISALPALAAARLARARCVLHVQDLEINAAAGLGLLPEWMIGVARRPEALIMRSFDEVIAVSREMASAIGETGGLDRVRILRNWADLSVNGRGEAEAVQAAHGIPAGKVMALYSGSIGRKQGVETMIDAARMLAQEDVVFTVCGEGPALGELERRAESAGNVRFLPLQDEEGHRRLLCRADIHIVPQCRGGAAAFMPSKLANICSCGGAVVCAAEEGSELAALVRAAGGRVCPPGDTHALARTVLALARNRRLRSNMGEAARALARERFDKSAALRQLEARILPPC
jgi:colanic acid biosynthesis glycosyl transferase WcaI